MINEELSNQNFEAFLKREYPYLLEVKNGVEEVQKATGFGDVSFVLRVQKNKVDMVEVIVAKRKMIITKEDNIFER